MCIASVSVTRKGSCREEYIRSALRYSDQVAVVVQVCCSTRSSGSASPSCIV
jgi:hypothetical protein